MLELTRRQALVGASVAVAVVTILPTIVEAEVVTTPLVWQPDEIHTVFEMYQNVLKSHILGHATPVITNKFDDLLLYAMDNFSKGSISTKEAQLKIKEFFDDPNIPRHNRKTGKKTGDAFTANYLRKWRPPAIIPVVIARQVLGGDRMDIRALTMKNWKPFVKAYASWLPNA